MAQYDRFLARLETRDDDRVLVDVSAGALADLAACVSAAVLHQDALVFRVLPPPLVEVAKADDKTLPTVVITPTRIAVKGAAAGRPVLSSLPLTSPRRVVIEADRSLPYGRIGAVAAAIGTPGHVTLVLRAR